MTYIDDAGKELLTDSEIEALEEEGYDLDKMTEDEITEVLNQMDRDADTNDDYREDIDL